MTEMLKSLSSGVKIGSFLLVFFLLIPYFLKINFCLSSQRVMFFLKARVTTLTQNLMSK